MKYKFNIKINFYIHLCLILFFFQGCTKSNNPIIEVKIVCLSSIVKSEDVPIPEKIGELFLPFGNCEGNWLRINPTFSRFDNKEQTFVPTLLGKSFAGNMNNKKLVTRLINRGLVDSKVPNYLSEKNFKSLATQDKIERVLKGHLKKSYFILFSTRPMENEKVNGFKIHYEAETVLKEINNYWCENKNKALPITIFLNPTIDYKEDDEYEEFGGRDRNEEYQNFGEIPFNTSSGLKQFAVFKIPFKPELFKQIQFVRNQTPDNLIQFLNSLEQTVIQSKESRYFSTLENYFAITGGMYEEKDNLPPGLIIENGKIIKPINLKRGKGNFYDPPPNGIFYISNNDVRIIESNFFQRTKNISFAIQTGPMLIMNNLINPRFEITSTNRYARAAVGLSTKGGKKIIIFVTSKDLVNFYELADFMKNKVRCEDALHLESINAYMSYPGYKYPVTNQKIMNLLVIR